MHLRVILASLTIALIFFTCLTCDLAIAQQETDEAVNDTSTVATETVAVEEVASDAEIRRRLTSILQATDWFDEIDVESNQGVVILTGTTEVEEHSSWAEALAGRTQDVVHVQNNIQVTTSLDLSSSFEVVSQSLYKLWQSLLRRLPMLIAGFAVVIATAVLANLSRALLRRLFVRMRRLRGSLKDLLSLLASIGIWVVGLLVAAIVVFPGMTPARALTFLGLGSVAIGFAFKDIFENFFAGVLILWRYPLDKGDTVQVGSTIGKVEDITVRNTLIRRLNGELTVVPNATIFKQEVDVLTNRELRRVQLTCGIAYDEDIDTARAVIKAAVLDCDSVRQDKPVDVLADCFADSSINFELFWWTSAPPMSVRKSRNEVVTAVKRALDEAAIEIPFPNRTLSFKEPVEFHRGSDAAGTVTKPEV